MRKSALIFSRRLPVIVAMIPAVFRYKRVVKVRLRRQLAVGLLHGTGVARETTNEPAVRIATRTQCVHNAQRWKGCWGGPAKGNSAGPSRTVGSGAAIRASRQAWNRCQCIVHKHPAVAGGVITHVSVIVFPFDGSP